MFTGERAAYCQGFRGNHRHVWPKRHLRKHRRTSRGSFLELDATAYQAGDTVTAVWKGNETHATLTARVVHAASRRHAG